MPDYIIADGPGSDVQEREIRAAAPDAEERLRRAELFLELPHVVKYDQPLDETLRVLSRFLVEHTTAIAAAFSLVRYDDMTTLGQGYWNLPVGYLEGMQRARQNSPQGDYLRDRAATDQTYVLRNARAYMLDRPEYEHMYPFIEQAEYETLIGVPFMVRQETIGIVFLYYREDVDVDDTEIAFARSIGEYAKPFMDNAWLFAESERKAAELEALSRADQALHESILLESVYQSLTNLAVELFGADRSLFLSWDETDHLHCFVARGVAEEELERLQEVYHAIARESYSLTSPDIRVIEDVQGNSRVHPGVRNVTTSASSVDIPVMVNEEIFGTFVLGYAKRRSFNEAERRLFRTLADRAGLALQNAVLFGESQRRANELEALHRADEALHRSLALQDVLTAMTELAFDLLGADSSLVATFGEDDYLSVVASRGLEPETFEILNESYHRLDRSRVSKIEGPLPVWLTENIHTEAKADERLRHRAAGAVAEIPVVVAGEIWGFFSIGWGRTRGFSPSERAMFDAFSARASLAIQNAVLFEESQRRAREMEALYRADEALHRSLALEDVLGAMIDLAIDLLGADSSLVASFGDDERLAVTVSRGLTPEVLGIINDSYQSFDRGHFERLPQPLRTGLIEDVHQSQRIDERLRNRTVGSFAEIPVVTSNGLWGIFSIGWARVRRFSDADRQVFEAFAARTSLAIQNALLFEQAQLSASLEERQRIARELHDSVSQALYGIGLGARTLRRRLGPDADAAISEPVEYIANLAEGGLAETRALIFELIPNSLQTDGLATALQRQAAATQARHQVRIDVILCDEPDVPIRMKEAIYRIAQESLGNVAKHARASAATLTLAQSESQLTLRISDNGSGFDTSAEFPGHFGLRSMAERAERVGGTFLIESTIGAGTSLTVTFAQAPT
ncbi:MAG: GAF domain-containing protein [bacterium]